MPFERLTETFYDHALTLPITLPAKDGQPERDTEYTIPSPDSDTGLFVQKVVILAARASRGDKIDDEDRDFLNAAPDLGSDELLGMVLSPPVLAQLKADDPPWPVYQKVLGAAMHWIAFGRTAAEEFWNVKAEEEGPKAPQDHKAPAKKTTARASSPRKKSARPPRKATTRSNSATSGP